MPSNSSDSQSSPIRKASFGHEPVLLGEVLKAIAPKDGGVYLDCTFGGGGHARAILNSANCKVVAIDRDPAAAERAKAFEAEFPGRFQFFAGEFSKLNELNCGGYAGILMDLGVSSFQLDEIGRGFSFRGAGPIDMRMDFSKGQTALEFIESSPLETLEKAIREYGEEPRYKKAARALKDAASAGALKTTLDLASVLEKALPKKIGSKIHPATLVFQALRIAVNDELGQAEEALPKAFERLSKGGVLAVITFHSLEDRLVKRFFKKMAGRPVDNNDSSSVQDRVKLAEILTRKPLTASAEEISQNPRSRSAKLRALMKI
ncbi:MAG: 16S rRNA (cytosine(1402)-N(4))-methyltransferase RsmH [Opitutales bacterium]|nr:16S rRNA (cytosine(1402)-N(4))-methyltransferase RsmH [Opitutales bacterium]